MDTRSSIHDIIGNILRSCIDYSHGDWNKLLANLHANRIHYETKELPDKQLVISTTDIPKYDIIGYSIAFDDGFVLSELHRE